MPSCTSCYFFSVMFALSLDYYFAGHMWSCTLTVLNLRGKVRLNEKFSKKSTNLWSYPRSFN